MVIFGTAIAGTRKSVSAIAFEGFKIRTTGTYVIVRAFILICTCRIIRRSKVYENKRTKEKSTGIVDYFRLP